MLPEAQKFARPPISNFRVGAVALGTSGALYPGANIEIPGNPLNQTVHAEQAAIANAYGKNERGIAAIAVTEAPCGHCRQFLNEIENGGSIRVLIKDESFVKLEQLLPSSFGPRDLGVRLGMFAKSPVKLRLGGTHDAVVDAALDAASRAYAPYSNASSGCAIETDRRTFAGSYLENAAFNPSLSPLQSALVNLVLAGEDFAAIRRVVLVEVKGAPIRQRASTEAVLAAIAPHARFERFESLRLP
jgi:cytidine deaminase